MAGARWRDDEGPLGGEKIGPNPTDRGKGGVKRSLLTDGHGTPLAIVIDGANRHDMKLVKRTLEDLKLERPAHTVWWPRGLCLDKGYDYTEVLDLVTAFGFTAHPRARDEEAELIRHEAGYRARRWVYLTPNTRMHVWDLCFAFSGTTPIHDHLQWGVESTVIAGRIKNYRFVESPNGDDYLYSTLKPGYGCYFKHDPLPIKLARGPAEIYRRGMSYSQLPHEIHWSVPNNGTITVMRKTPTDDAESARVF